MTAIRLGANAFRREETVVNYDSSVGIAYETAVVTTVGTLESTVELTVAERDVGLGIDNCYEATVSGIAIHTTVDGD